MMFFSKRDSLRLVGHHDAKQEGMVGVRMKRDAVIDAFKNRQKWAKMWS
jgi:hypothetical protein